MRKLTFVTLIILSFANCSPSCPRPLSWIDLLNTNVDHQLLIEAAQTWNDAVQVELFKWSYRGGTVQVWEYPNVTMPDWRPGEPDIYTGRADTERGTSRVIKGVCRVFLEENDLNKFYSLVHELGHCLSLPDEYNNPDPDPTSIMAWGTEIKPWHISHIRTCLDLEPLEN